MTQKLKLRILVKPDCYFKKKMAIFLGSTVQKAKVFDVMYVWQHRFKFKEKYLYRNDKVLRNGCCVVL